MEEAEACELMNEEELPEVSLKLLLMLLEV